MGQVYIRRSVNWVILGVNYIISNQQRLLWHQFDKAAGRARKIWCLGTRLIQHALFGKELDCASVVTATHTYTICYKMAFDLHPIICTWNVVSTWIPVTVFFPLGVWLGSKKIINKVMNECWEKPQKCMCMSNVLAFFTWSLTPQLDTVIIEVKGLSLSNNPLRLYRAKHLPLMNWTYGDTGFYIG